LKSVMRVFHNVSRHWRPPSSSCQSGIRWGDSRSLLFQPSSLQQLLLWYRVQLQYRTQESSPTVLQLWARHTTRGPWVGATLTRHLSVTTTHQALSSYGRS
jgi:hypothetical protein